MNQRFIRLRQGKDEFRFAEKDRAVAEMLAAELPKLRVLSERISGWPLPASIRIVVAGDQLRFQDVMRISDMLKAMWLLSILALILALFGAVGEIHQKQDHTNQVLSFLLLTGMVIAAVRILPVYRAAKNLWSKANGISIGQNLALLPVIALRWPPMRTQSSDIKNPSAVLFQSTPDDDSALVKNNLAHELGHCVLGSIRQGKYIPLWFNEGFAELFSEWAAGKGRWSIESRKCVEEVELRGGAKSLLHSDPERYVRLLARYYWEVRTLAEQGKLQEALRASNKELEAMRPRLKVEGEEHG